MLAIPGLALGQNLTVKITTTSGATPVTKSGQPSLEAALNGIAITQIKSLEISEGTFNAADWEYLKAKKDTLTSLSGFVITDGLADVADIPDTDADHPFFSATLTSFSVAKLQKIGKNAFYNCTKLKDISMPQVVEIGSYGLYNTGALVNVNLPMVAIVGSYAFNSSGIESLTLPSATIVNAYAFCNTGYLTRLILPKIKTIKGNNVFYGSALTYLGVGTTRPSIAVASLAGLSSPRYLVLVDDNGVELTGIAYDDAVAAYGSVWEGFKTDHNRSLTVKVNGGAAVQGASLEEALATSGVGRTARESIEVVAGEMAATDWVWLKKNSHSKLASFTITDGVTAIANIPALTGSKTYFPYTVFNQFSAAKLSIIGYRAFFNMQYLTSVNLPNTVAIDQQAFSACYSLKNVNVPAVTLIDASAFAQCGSLTTIHLPSVTQLKNKVFDGSALVYLKLSSSVPSTTATTFEGAPSPRFIATVDANGNKLTGSALTTAENNYKGDKGYNATTEMWRGCKINETQKSIKARINGSIEASATTLEGVIGSLTYSTITSIKVLAGEFLASDWVFLKEHRADFSKLQSFIIPDSATITAVSDMPAAPTTSNYFNTQLKEFAVAKMQRVGRAAFYNTANLSSVMLPSVKQLEDYSFIRCSKLLSLTVPQLKQINGTIFANSAVNEIKVGATPPTVAKGIKAFDEMPVRRFLLLCDSKGNILTGEALATALDAYRNHEGYDPVTKLWYGWSLEKSVDSLVMIINNILTVKHEDFANCIAEAASQGVDFAQIERLEVVEGYFNTPDWKYLYDQRDKFTGLKYFAITDGCSGVANLGTGLSFIQWEPSAPIEELHVSKLLSIGASGFRGNGTTSELRYVYLPNTKSLANYALRYHPKLTKVCLPSAEEFGSQVIKDTDLRILQMGSNPPRFLNNAPATWPNATSSTPRYVQFVNNLGEPLTGDEQAYVRAAYQSDANYESSSKKWAGLFLGNTVLLNTEDVDNGAISIPYSIALADTIKNPISIAVAPEAGYRLKDGSLLAYRTDNPSEMLAINGNSLTLPKAYFSNPYDITITVEFEPITYLISANANPVEAGSVGGTGMFNEGASTTLIASPNTGYWFVKWLENGSVVGTETSLQLDNITAAHDFVAEFEAISVSGVTLSPVSIEITQGNTKQLEVSITPENALNKVVSWTSSNSNFASVDGNGLVTANAVGDAVITVKTEDGGYTATCSVSVVAKTIPVTGVSLSETTLTLKPGDTHTLTATVAPDNATNQNVTWSSSNNSIAAVDENGVVTAVAGGKATITVTTVDGSKKATCAVTVEIPVIGITLSSDYMELAVGESITLTATVLPNNATDKTVEWVSEDESVASVNNGKVTAHAVGLTKITATTVDGGFAAECEIEVVEPNIPVTSVSLNETTLTLNKGEMYTLIATVLPDNATNRDVEWKSADESVASVDNNGIVEAIAGGSTVISVVTVDGAKTAFCNVTVNADQYTITVEANPAEGGDVTGGGVYDVNTTVTLTAIAKEGYTFKQWNDGETNATREVTVTGNATYVAEFEKVNVPTPTQYTITVEANPAEGGDVTGGGVYDVNTTVTLTAIAKEGYTFKQWSDGETNATREVTVAGNATYVAVFEAKPVVSYTLTYVAGPNGSITGNAIQTVDEGQSGEAVSATAYDGYRFVRWSDGSTDNPRIDENVRGDISVVAEFEEIPCYAESHEFSAIACGSYDWNGQVYTASDDYKQTFITAAGCDSTVTLHLTIGQPQTGEFTVTCTNSHEWEGVTYTETGDYTRTFTTVAGCDSIVTMHLTIIHSEETGVNVTVAETLNIFPNPTVGVVQVDMPSADASEVLVFNANGQLLQIIKTQGQAQARIDLSELPSGMYFVRIGNALGKVIKI